MDFWLSRVQLVKPNSLGISQHNHLEYLNGDDDLKACIACPLCDADIEAKVLFSHLQEDHGFELKNSFKRKSHKPSPWSSYSFILGKELSSFLESPNYSKGNSQESQPDTNLSAFLSTVSRSGSNAAAQIEFSGNSASNANHSERVERILLKGNMEIDLQVRRKRVAFVQELMASVIL